MMFRHVVLFLFLTTVPALALAGPYEDGVEAHKKGELDKAVELYDEAANQGVVEAQLQLGYLYLNGSGVDKNLARAFSLFKKAAEQDDVNGQLQLGMMFDNGLGVPRDYGEAAFWYDKAARQNSANAQITLGLMYAVGQGVPQDNVMAHVWLNLASAQGIAEAGENRDAIEQQMSPEEIGRAQKRARELLDEMTR